MCRLLISDSIPLVVTLRNCVCYSGQLSPNRHEKGNNGWVHYVTIEVVIEGRESMVVVLVVFSQPSVVLSTERTDLGCFASERGAGPWSSF